MQQETCKNGMYFGVLAKGCELCITGEKSVFFVTGICPRHCFYCPISEQKWQKDVTYINEWPTQNWDDIVTEIRLCKSKGVGITGGDPLARIERTCNFIKKLKETFGKDFHIHLYTSLNLFTKENLQKLHEAGLDEIRCHPDITDQTLWSRIQNGAAFDWHFGMEIPAIPGKEKETSTLINFAKKYVHFINMNELEYSDTNASHLEQFGYKTKDTLSYGIHGSEELAKTLLARYNAEGIQIHYCSASFKDNIQMRRRLERRAASIKKKYDILTPDGTISHGVIYLNNLVPGIGYNEKMAAVNKEVVLRQLKEAKYCLEKKSYFSLLDIDEKKIRILCSERELRRRKENIKRMNLVPAIVEEYPTYDALEVELDFL